LKKIVKICFLFLNFIIGRKNMFTHTFIQILILSTSILGFFLVFFISAAMGGAGGASPSVMVNSVLGPIPADQLGATLVHEHFAFAYPGWFADETMAPYDFDEVLKTNLGVIAAAQKYGIATIIDATTNDVGGRDPELYKALSRKTGIHIICSTGLYTENEGSPMHFKLRQRLGIDISAMISELFIKEITDGIGSTGVKAGVIKVGTSSNDPISPYETAVLKAAAMAQKATGVPIITHTSGPVGGVEQAELFLKEGADPKKIMIGHVSNSSDIEYHKAILSKGVNIAFDRIGMDFITPTDTIVENIVELCKLGYENHIMLSHDTVNVWLGRPTALSGGSSGLMANSRVDYISSVVIPKLKEKGLTDKQVETMMIHNPRNLFLGK